MIVNDSDVVIGSFPTLVLNARNTVLLTSDEEGDWIIFG